MKIALAQVNPTIGDFPGNSKKISCLVNEAKRRGCGLVIFPELALSGYPPQDLIYRGTFMEDHDAALSHLLQFERGIGILCGSIEKRVGCSGKPFYNSAVLFEDGQILFTARKRLLPTYDVFDEPRYFEPGKESIPFRYKGLTLGITICEDIFNNISFFPQPPYDVDPLADLARASENSLDLLINISASPFNLGKYAMKHRMFKNICATHNVHLVYANQVGGQDSLLFDGHSLVMAPKGDIIAQAKDFNEDLVVFDPAANTGDLHPVLQGVATDETSVVFEALVMGTRDYVTKCGFKKGVLGLSGGIDSAVTAAIARYALGPDNVLGVALPSPYTANESIEDAAELAKNLGIRFEVIPITPLFKAYCDTLSPLFQGLGHDITEQNIQARIRGNILMALANKFGSLLLSTGNKSEMAVGYCTLYGDMSGGLAVISDVPKVLVYKLAGHINKEREIIPGRVLTRPPTAELKPDQKDEDDLPPYEVLDPIIKAYLEDNLGIREIVEMGYNREIVEDVVRRITISEYKRKQAPLGLKVTTKAFGHGRRYPTAQYYREGKTA